jgi:hypothetical protein
MVRFRAKSIVELKKRRGNRVKPQQFVPQILLKSPIDFRGCASILLP